MQRSKAFCVRDSYDSTLALFAFFPSLLSALSSFSIARCFIAFFSLLIFCFSPNFSSWSCYKSQSHASVPARRRDEINGREGREQRTS